MESLVSARMTVDTEIKNARVLLEDWEICAGGGGVGHFQGQRGPP